MAIRWETYIWDEPRPVESNEVEHFEQKWGVRFPDEYKKLVSMYQGMAPEPSVFDAGKFRDVFCVLLTLTIDEERETYSIARAYDVLKPHVPSGIIPFGKTSGGEFLCFDYRAAPEHPKVVLVTVETTIKAVASSFADFMASLHDGRAPRVSR